MHLNVNWCGSYLEFLTQLQDGQKQLHVKTSFSLKLTIKEKLATIFFVKTKCKFLINCFYNYKFPEMSVPLIALLEESIQVNYGSD